MAQDISSASSISSVQNLDQDYNSRKQHQDRVENKNKQTGQDELRKSTVVEFRSGKTQESSSTPLEEKLNYLEQSLRGQDQEDSEEAQEMLEDIRQSLNITLEPINIKLDYSRNEEIDEVVVEVLNRETEEVIRQIPPEAMVNMAKRMEEMTGLLVDGRV